MAAADGVVTRVDTIEDPAIGPGPRHRIVTFLSPLDVHVQRTPVAGEVDHHRARARQEGGGLPRRRRPLQRESSDGHSRAANGDLVGVRQIVGAVARRIVCYLRPGQTVHAGELMGLSSSAPASTLILPGELPVLATAGQRLRNGETADRAPPPAADRARGAP